MEIRDLIKFKNLNKRNRITLGLLIMAFAILAIVLIANYKRSHKPIQVKEIDKKETTVIKKTEELKGRKARKKKPIEIEAMLDEVGREDPFLPASEKYIPVAPAHTGQNLTGIIWDAKKPLAIINNMIVGEGEIIGNKKIIKIEKESVLISENGKEYILRLGGFKTQKEGE